MRAVNKKVKTQHGRPLTYDFLKNSVEELGFKARSPSIQPGCAHAACLRNSSTLELVGCADS